MGSNIYKGLFIEGDKVVRCDYIELDENDDEYYEPVYVTIPEGIREICQDAFVYFPKELYIEFPSTLEIIGDYAFYGCEFDFELEDELPIGLKKIGAHAFEKCNLTHLNLPQRLEEIGEFAFANNELEEVVIPKSVKKIGEGAFSSPDALFWGNCKSVGHITVETGNKHFLVESNCLVDFFNKTVISHTDSSVKKIKIPPSVLRIGSFAFSNLENLSTISFGLVDTIGYAAFVGCTNLSVAIDYPIQKIEEGAFSNIKHICLENTLDFRMEEGCLIDNNDCLLAIDESQSPTSLCVPYGVKRIGNYASVNNEKIHILYFSDSSIDSIGAFAFRNCVNLKYIDFNWKLNHIQNSAFENCEILTYIQLPQFLQSIGDRAFRGCNEIKTVLMPSSVREMGQLVFGVDWSSSSRRDLISNIFIECYPKKIDIYCEEWTPTDIWDKHWNLAHNNIALHKWCKFKYDENGIPELDFEDVETDSFDKETANLIESPEFSNNDILYIYKGNIRCHRYCHHIIQATAILHDKTDNEIELNVEYCTECKKFLLEYSIFEQYRNRYGVLIANFRMVVNGEFDGEYDLAEESPLMLSGYNVSQRDGYTSNERQYILARIIHDDIMDKGDVIRYLSYFIRKNGAKRGNELALSKWKEDLAFVQDYNKNIQPRAIITDIKKY